MWTQTVHFPISFNTPQLATWDYPHYPIIHSFSPFFFFFLVCEVQVQGGEDFILAC